ncbi:MAG TPA: magnesium transporter [Anaerolineales bacterium]|nr:magnesium transporter [Anaerolineales bacterium]
MEPSVIDVTLEEIRRLLERGEFERAIAALIRLRPADRAEAFADLPEDDQAALLPRLDIPAAADLLEELEDTAAASAAESLPTERLADVLDEMEPDEAADILGDLDPTRAAQALAEMEEAEEVRPLLGHPDESAGGLMTTDYVALRRQTTAAQAIEFLRQTWVEQAATPYYLYVVDRDRKLLGVVGLRELVVAPPETVAEALMARDIVYVTTDTDQEEAARQMSHYDLFALPVVDPQGVLQGVITHDDIIDVLEEEATEDVLSLGAVQAGSISDRPYWTLRAGEIVRSRFTWLLVLFVAQTLTSMVMRRFQDQLSAAITLALFIPLLIGTGGNAGSQTVATVIRGLALQEIEPRDAGRVLLREVRNGALLGLLLGPVAFIWVLLTGAAGEYALVVAATVFVLCIWANAVGALVPILAAVLGIDPTVMSAPLISTLVDATGLLIYFSVAIAVLGNL